MSRLIVTVILFISFDTASAQNQDPYQFLGPSSKPITLVDTGSWSPNGMGWIESLYVDPSSPNWIWAGSNTGGLYFTRDHGENWVSLHEYWDPVTGVLSIAPLGNGHLLVGTGNPVFPQSYGHAELKIPRIYPIYFHHSIKGLKMEPVWGIEPLKRLLWRSVKITPTKVELQHRFGGNWITVLHDPAAFKQLLVSSLKSNYMAAAGSRLWISKNGGGTWDEATGLLTGIGKDTTTRIAVSEDRSDKSRLWCAYTAGGTFYLDVSNNWGESWENRCKTRKIQRADIHHIELQVSPDNSEVIYVGAVRLFKSEDGGKYFEQVTRPIHGHPQFTHDDVRSMQVLSSQHVVLGTDGGVFETVDGGITWQDLSGNGLCVTQFYGVGVSPNGNVVMGGTQDLSQMFLKDSSWYNTSTLYADGGDVVFDPVDTGAVFISRSGSLMRSDQGYHIWRRVHPPVGRFSFLFPFTISENGNWYTGRWELWKRDSTWKNITKNLGKFKYSISAIMAVDGKGDSLWFAVEEPTWNPNRLEGKLYSTGNGGETWTDQTSNLPILAWRGISSLVRDSVTGNVYVGFKQIDTTQETFLIYQRTPEGTWTNWSNGLTATHINSLCWVNGSVSRISGLFAGTGRGLFWFEPNQEKWIRLEGKLPAVPVTDIAYDPVHQRLVLSTYGNGMWEYNLKNELRR